MSAACGFSRPGPAVASSPRAAADSPGLPRGPQIPARGRGALEPRRCRQNRGSFRRTFASRVGRGLAALRQDGGRKTPAERAIRPPGIHASIGRLATGEEWPRTLDGAAIAVASPSPSRWDREAARRALLVERVSSSDMLTRAYNAGISRGFEFSATCIRRFGRRSEARGDRLSDTARRRAAAGSSIARTGSGFWVAGSFAPFRTRRGNRWIPEVEPSHRVLRMGKQGGPSPFGVGEASQAAASEGRGMGLALAKTHWVASLKGPAPLASRGTRNEETVG